MTDKQPPSPNIAWRFSDAYRIIGRPEGDNAYDEALSNSWGELLRTHMPYQPISDDARARLVDALRQIELLFHSGATITMRRYYQQAFLAQRSEEPIGEREELRHIVALQAQLMEQAYYTLKLGRYANAPTNRGWMNLFRRWGRNETFKTLFDNLRPLLSRALLHFYDDYIRDTPEVIDVRPVRHPWDDARQRSKAVEKDEEDEQWSRQWSSLGIIHSTDPGEVPGIYLDSGIIETSSRPGGEAAGGTRPPKAATPEPDPPKSS
jgi:hypothetical protein